MVTKTLEVVEPKVKGAKQALVENAPPTELVETPTTGVYKTEADFQTAVSKGLESMTKQHSILQQETKTTKADAEARIAKAEAKVQATEATVTAYEESIASLEKRLEQERDPLELKDYRLEIREKKVALKEASIEAEKARLEQERAEHKAEREGWLFATEMDAYKKELLKTYQVPNPKILDIAKSKAEMEEIAKEFPEISKEPPKVDSAIPSGAEDWRSLSPERKIQLQLERDRKK